MSKFHDYSAMGPTSLPFCAGQWKNRSPMYLSWNCRLRRLDPYCRPKLQRARFVDFLGPVPHSDWAPERFWRLLAPHALRCMQDGLRFAVPAKPNNGFSLTAKEPCRPKHGRSRVSWRSRRARHSAPSIHVPAPHLWTRGGLCRRRPPSPWRCPPAAVPSGGRVPPLQSAT
jgi:hypothetical protein